MTAVNRHLALVEELALPEYSAMTDQQRYDSLKLEDIPVLIPITSQSIMLYFESIDKWNTMNQLSIVDQSQTPPEPRNDTAYHTRLVLVTFTEFDMNNPTASQVLNDLLTDLVSQSIITQQDMDNILAMGDSFISRDTEIGVPDVAIGEVEQARTV